MLDFDYDFCEFVKVHDAFVVGGPEGGEECWGDGEEGEVFDVGVTRRMVVSTGCLVCGGSGLLRWMVGYDCKRAIRSRFTSEKVDLR